MRRITVTHIKKYPVVFGITLTLGFLHSCVSFLIPVFLGDFFTLYFHHNGSSKGRLLGLLGIHVNTLEGFFLFFIILLVIQLFTGYLEGRNSYWLGEQIVKDIRESVFRAQMNWPASLLSKNQYGKYLLRYSNDMKAIQNYFSRGILGGIKNLLFLLTGVLLLSCIHVRLTIILTAMLLFICGIMYLVSKYQKPFIRTARSRRSSLLAFVSKAFSRYEKVTLQGHEKEMVAGFNDRSGQLFHANMRTNRWETLLNSLSSFMFFAMIGLLLWQMMFSYGYIRSGDGIVMLLVVMMMQRPLRNIMKVPGYLNKGSISLQKIDQILSVQPPATNEGESA